MGRRAGAGAAFALLTLAIFAWLGATSGTTAALACAHATDRPHQTSLAKLGKAMHCLVNNKRATRTSLRALKHNDRLATRRAAPHEDDAEEGLLQAPLPG